jgi:hypothetical protein
MFNTILNKTYLLEIDEIQDESSEYYNKSLTQSKNSLINEEPLYYSQLINSELQFYRQVTKDSVYSRGCIL